ncbi:MAG: sigma-70 family RNA polymerase sigma factor [Bacteroidota bacterium]
MKDEKDIIGLILKGDSKTISKIYQECFPAIRQMVLTNSGDKEEAKDIFQETMVVLYRKIKNDSLTLNCTLSTYIYSISRNMWLDKLRRKGKFQNVMQFHQENSGPDKNLIDLIHQNETYALYQKHFQRLGEDCKKILCWFFEGKDMKFIAREMNYKSEGYARKRKFKCKDKLIRNIQNDPVYHEITEGNSLDNHTIN